jgi:quinoprotein glucose dehydrogenase
VYSNRLTRVITLVNDPQRSDMDFINGASGGGYGGGLTVQGLPIVKPPWGQITAIDLNDGEIVWQVAHGETPDMVRNHPALQGVEVPRTGQFGPLGTLTTRALVISGEREFTTTSTGERGAMLRAYDKATGEEVGQVFMPGPQTGSPMTYMLDGKQYIVIAAGGGPEMPAALLAYALP